MLTVAPGSYGESQMRVNMRVMNDWLQNSPALMRAVYIDASLHEGAKKLASLVRRKGHFSSERRPPRKRGKPIPASSKYADRRTGASRRSVKGHPFQAGFRQRRKAATRGRSFSYKGALPPRTVIGRARRGRGLSGADAAHAVFVEFGRSDKGRGGAILAQRPLGRGFVRFGAPVANTVFRFMQKIQRGNLPRQIQRRLDASLRRRQKEAERRAKQSIRNQAAKARRLRFV